MNYGVVAMLMAIRSFKSFTLCDFFHFLLLAQKFNQDSYQNINITFHKISLNMTLEYQTGLKIYESAISRPLNYGEFGTCVECECLT